MGTTGKGVRTGRLVARVASIIVGAAFIVILGLIVTNEDPPDAGGAVVVALLALELVACAAAWRWERAGGLAVVAGATALAASIWFIAPASQRGVATLLGMGLYGLPFLLVGLLFIVAAGRRANGPAD